MNQYSGAANLNHAKTYERDYLLRLNEETVGLVGEYVVGRRLGTSWGHINTFHGVPDSGPLEVRATKHEDGSLILREWEFSSPGFADRAFVLVCGVPPQSVRIVGWLFGHEGRRRDWLRDVRNFGKPAYFVPQHALHPFEQLETDEQLRTCIGLPSLIPIPVGQRSFWGEAEAAT